MVASGKGILAIDESHSTCKKRFDGVGIACTEETRRDYRELLITAPGIEEHISGMILFDETIRQSTRDGMPFPAILKSKGMITGIKVDTGAQDLALHAGEKVTEGLDGLRERLIEYKALGAEFTKWRAVITIGKNMPSEACIQANAHALARYAALAQSAGLVPMVEPEVLMDGEHTIERCYEVSAHMLKILFAQLAEHGVAPEGTILKTSMILSGTTCPAQADVDEVAEKTIQCLTENVPHNLAGIVFLSGGQSDEKATAHLNRMNQIGKNLPWPLSFSYGRAIQSAALKIWASANMNDRERAQQAVVKRSALNGLAALGKYSPELEKALV